MFVGMPEQLAGRLSVASLNTRGVPVLGSHLAGHCIDFILTPAGVKAQATGLLLAGQVELPGGPGYASDHISLHADLLVAPCRSSESDPGR